ncbi:MAG: caspase family protein [Bacteroidota bacterium]
MTNTNTTLIPHWQPGFSPFQSIENQQLPLSHEKLVNTQFNSPEKFALIVAVSKYEDKRWTPLHAYNDVRFLKIALAKQGFDTLTNVKVIQDEEATSDGIVNAIEQYLLVHAKPNTSLFFAFAGHGQQVAPDYDGDEIDGKDEALVAYDAPKSNRNLMFWYDGKKHLLDDTLGHLFTQVRQKLGPSGELLVLLDACHSGTATRSTTASTAVSRGTDEVIWVSEEPELVVPNAIPEKEENWQIHESGSKMAPMVVISASRPAELAYEIPVPTSKGDTVGPLAYAYYKASASINNTTSYSGLFDWIKLEMAAARTGGDSHSPTIEGDIERLVLAGSDVPKIEYYNPIGAVSDSGIIQVDVGTIDHIHQGTKVAFYDIDTRDTSRVIARAEGVVVQANFTESLVQISPSYLPSDLSDTWVFITEQNFGNMEVSVSLDLEAMPRLRQELLEELSNYSLIKVKERSVENVDLRIELYQNNKTDNDLNVRLCKYNFSLVDMSVTEPSIPRTCSLLIEKILSHAQAKFLVPVQVKGDYDLTMEILPANAACKINDKVMDGKTEINVRQNFRVKITNNGRKRAYFAIIMIAPDDKVYNKITNLPGYEPEDYYIENNTTIVLPKIKEDEKCYQIPNYLSGNYVFKIFASRKPLKLNKTFNSRGDLRASALRDIEDENGEVLDLDAFFIDSFKRSRSPGEKVSSTTKNLKISTIHIDSHVIEAN